MEFQEYLRLFAYLVTIIALPIIALSLYFILTEIEKQNKWWREDDDVNTIGKS